MKKVKLALLTEKLIVAPLNIAGDRTLGTSHHSFEMFWTNDGLLLTKGDRKVLFPPSTVQFVEFASEEKPKSK